MDNSKKKTVALILAGGRGERLKATTPKPLFPLLGEPAIFYVVKALARFDLPLAVVASKAISAEVSKLLPTAAVLPQGEGGYGTAYAVSCAADLIKNYEEVLILQSDDPLVENSDLEELLNFDLGRGLGVLELLDDRRIQEVGRAKISRQRIVKIGERRSRGLVNLGRYRLKVQPLLKALAAVERVGGEQQLTSAIDSMLKEGKIFYTQQKSGCFINMNRLAEARQASRILNRRRTDELESSGVYLEWPEQVCVGPLVQIGAGVRLIGQVHLLGRTEIGECCTIEDSTLKNVCLGAGVRVEGCRVESSSIGSFSTLLSSHLDNAIIKTHTAIGPYAHLRPGSVVGDHCRVGNFVEVKNSVLHSKVKANHLSYLGDSEIGEGTNIGCGVITANYDGRTKFKTAIGAGCFVGCNSTLVAPIKIGADSYVAAGSTLTDSVEPESLAIGRARQVTKTGRAKKYLARGKSDA